MKTVLKATGKKLRTVARFMASKEAVAALELIALSITVFNAVDAYRDSKRKIGFKTNNS